MIVDIDFFSLNGYIGGSGVDEETISWITDNFGTSNLDLIEVVTSMTVHSDPIISSYGNSYKASKRLLYEYTTNIIEDPNLRLSTPHDADDVFSDSLVYLLAVKSEKIENRINSSIDGVITVVMEDSDRSKQYTFTSIEDVPDGYYVVIHSTEKLPVEVRDPSTYNTVLEEVKEEIRSILRESYRIEKRLTDSNNFFNVWIGLDPVTL